MFNINEFKSIMNKYGGPAKSNLFVLELGVGNPQDRKSQFITSSDLRFFCSEVSVPPINVNTASYRQNTIDIPQSMPMSLSTPSINATFMLDSEHRIVSFFHSWMQEIINYDSSQGILSAINNDHLPYEIGYKADYALGLSIKHYKTNATNSEITQVYEYFFYDVFPTEVGGKILTWSPSDSIATITVNFSASSYSFSASEPGQIISDLSRGNGYLDFLNSVGFRGQTVQQRNLPTTIQDAINSFTRVRNNFRQVRDTLRSIF